MVLTDIAFESLSGPFFVVIFRITFAFEVLRKSSASSGQQTQHRPSYGSIIQGSRRAPPKDRKVVNFEYRKVRERSSYYGGVHIYGSVRICVVDEETFQILVHDEVFNVAGLGLLDTANVDYLVGFGTSVFQGRRIAAFDGIDSVVPCYVSSRIGRR